MSFDNNPNSPDESDMTVVERVATSPDILATVSIVRAVAEAESVNPGTLPLLAEVIDPESVDDLFAPDTAVGRSGVRLSFDYCGYVVQITDDFVTLYQ